MPKRIIQCFILVVFFLFLFLPLQPQRIVNEDLFTAKFDIDSLYICPPYLYTVATLPWEIQKVIFQQYYSYTLQIITLSQKKQTATVVLQLICLLTVVYCFLLSA